MLLTGRFVVSIPWQLAEENRYYWEHCFWIDNSDFANNAQMNLAVLGDMGLLYTEQVRFHGCRWYDPSDMSVVFQVLYPSTQNGNQPAQVNYNILIAARWRMWGSDESYTYHLHRQPMGEGYITDGVYSPTGRTQQQTRLNTFVAQGIYRTKTGSLIDRAQLGDLPVMWQLRHGTKRSQKRFWLP